MTVVNVILYFVILCFYCKFIHSQIRNGAYRTKNVIDQHEGSGNDQENATNYLKTKLPSLDDEDSMKTDNSKSFQSSGDGAPEPPDVYPSLHPYTKSRSTATILIDIAVENEYKSYMLPGSPIGPELNAFHKKIIKNLKEEMITINVDLSYKIISLRPGPLIPKRHNARSAVLKKPSVFVRINVTQYNSSIVNPMIIFHISYCGRLGILGNLTISDQVIFPQYVCQNDQVFCFPECRKGSYCDGISDCPDTNLDESPSCPKCINKNLKVTTNTDNLNEGENLSLVCEFKESCSNLQKKIQWTFPRKLEQYQANFKGHKSINSLPKHRITSGIYRCSLDGDSAIRNITVFKKPRISLTNTIRNAEELIMTELYGSDINLWCNSSSGTVQWLGSDFINGNVNSLDKNHAQLYIRKLSATIDVKCQIKWGFEERGHTVKSVRINVVCDSIKHFRCTKSGNFVCIPINQKCDSIPHCDDGSDEKGCKDCTEKSLSVDSGQNIFKDKGDPLMLSCSATKESCYPLKWLRFNKPLESHGHLVVYKQSVFILNVSSEHSGVYRCTDSSGVANIDVSLTVYEPPLLQINSPLTEINITVGQSREIECSIPESKILSEQNFRPIWIFENSKRLQNDVNINFLPNKTSILSFTRATKAINGNYRCEVMWGLGYSRKSSITVKINVVELKCNDDEKICADKMKCISNSMWCDGQKQCYDGSDEEMCKKCRDGFVIVQPTSVVMLSRESVQITCYYHQDCYPVEWRVAHSKVPINSINGVNIMDNKLQLSNVGLDASNVYECFSGDKISHTNVTVISEIIITFVNNPGYVFVDYGNDIQVDCQSDYGEPMWKKRDFKSIEDISGANQTYIQPNIVRLTIKSASYDARGYYNCSVRLPGSNREVARKLMFFHVYDLVCPENHIKCDKNTKCVPKQKICDNIMDCSDNEDEKNCRKCNYNLDIKPRLLFLSTSGWGSMHCIVPHKDCFPIEWHTKNGEKLNPKNFIQYNDSLFMFNPVPRESEEIICSNGQKSASAFLTVKSLELTIIPHKSDDSTLYINKDDNKIIECKSTLGTPQWIFPKSNMLVNVGVQYLMEEPNVAKILMTNVKENASGIYVCSVTFSRETKKKSLSIKVI